MSDTTDRIQTLTSHADRITDDLATTDYRIIDTDDGVAFVFGDGISDEDEAAIRDMLTNQK